MDECVDLFLATLCEQARIHFERVPAGVRKERGGQYTSAIVTVICRPHHQLEVSRVVVLLKSHGGRIAPCQQSVAEQILNRGLGPIGIGEVLANASVLKSPSQSYSVGPQGNEAL